MTILCCQWVPEVIYVNAVAAFTEQFVNQSLIRLKEPFARVYFRHREIRITLHNYGIFQTQIEKDGSQATRTRLE